MARLAGTLALALGATSILVILGCGPDDLPRPMPYAGFWDEGRAEAAAVTALHVDPDDYTATLLAEGDAVVLVHGPQGGTHVELEIHAAGVDPASTATGARLLRGDGTVVAEAFQRDYYGEPAAFVQRIFLQPYESLDGPLTLVVRVRDSAGAQGTTEVGVTVR